MGEVLKGAKSFVIGGAAVVLGTSVLLGLDVKNLPGLALIIGGLGLVALRLAVKKAES
tara:strand:- start:1028 stop:1201 length:174 start_codon:yes stop_codon:yes gene_type:complete